MSNWNCAVVHGHGPVELIEDRPAAYAVLERMGACFESALSPRAQPWQTQLAGLLAEGGDAELVDLKCRPAS